MKIVKLSKPKQPLKIETNIFKRRYQRILQLVTELKHRQLWIEFGLWTNGLGGWQNYPNGIFHPSEEDRKAKERFAFERRGEPVPLHLMASTTKNREEKKRLLSSVTVENFSFAPTKGH